jgi:hypothetical protein
VFKKRRIAAFRKGVIQYTQVQIRQGRVGAHPALGLGGPIGAALMRRLVLQEQYQMWKNLLADLRKE